ncbi:Dienelactone hydrolase [Chondromyces apiculatus DSM 436]|uniref:Dienelactone hydrolase n=2 Tax=Chondromyces apiculatus TaxID=51 RepID=A0A017T4G4_9BACT|nr:Dienelactone hydrolase [Chondromyces apiculatus DSM 436]
MYSAAMQGSLVDLSTASGPMRAYEVGPAGAGPHPSLLFLMDGLGFREVLFPMADRFAAGGYRVLVPDLFHRIGPDVHFDAKVVFSSPDKLAEMRKVLSQVDAAGVMEDVAVCLDRLAAPGEAAAQAPAPMGIFGYCMGGRFAFMAAAHFPERIGAAASIHGGNLVTAAPDSPHRDADRIKARLYFAIAEQDGSFTSEDEATLRQALERCGARFEMEHYAARHAWTMTDAPVYSPTEAERHFGQVLAFFDSALREG